MARRQTHGSAFLAPGMQVGPWRVLLATGLGAYGFIYRVERAGQEHLGPFALKMARYPKDPRFEREAEMLSRVRHPHVPRLQDRGEWTAPDGDTFPFLVMDWIDGVTLYAWAFRQPRSLHARLRALAQVARALEATHAVGGVHRDVKGENVLVRMADGAAVLMDFGSANYLGASVLTRHPLPPGTPLYQSPEAQRFEFEHASAPTARYKARPSDDVYALGMMAHRLVTGRYPPPVLEVEPTEDGSLRLKSVPLVPPEQWGALSPELSALLRRMLSEDPSARGSAADVAQALEAAAEREGHEAALARASRSTRAAVLAASRWVRPRARSMALAAGALLSVMTGWMIEGWLHEHPASTVPEAGTSRLGDMGNAVPASGQKPHADSSGLHEGVPKKPLPSQLRPPCPKPMVELQKACWIERTEEKPPCTLPSAEWKGKCYWPVASLQQPSTSNPP